MISNGGHPFGDSLKRHANILSYEYDLKHFKEKEELDSSEVYVLYTGYLLMF